MIGARGKLLPRLVTSFSLRPAEKDGPPDDIEEVEEIEFVVSEGVSNGVGYWRADGLNGQHGARNQSECSPGPLSSIFSCAMQMWRGVVKISVHSEGKGREGDF